MSACMVEQEVINNIVAKLHAQNSELLSEIMPEELGYAIAKLNERALVYRYGTCEKGAAKKYKYEPVSAPSLLIAYRHMRTLLYQCSEGPHSMLYKALVAEANRWAHRLVTEFIEQEKNGAPIPKEVQHV